MTHRCLSHLLGWMLAASAVTVFAPDAEALDPKKNLRQYVHQAWSIEHGLPQVTIQNIAQTDDGYLWLATQEGLARFDGVRFVTYDKTNTPAMKANDVKGLLIDKQGVIWIGLNGGGLVKYDRQTFRGYTVADGLVDDKVFCLAEARTGELLVGTVGGLSVLVGNEFSNFTTKNGLPFDVVNDILEDRQGRIWLATGKGLARYEAGKIFPAPELAPLADKGMESLFQDKAGRLWIGSWGHGLYRWDGKTLDHWGAEQGLPNQMISSIAEDRDGNLYVGTFGGGLARFADGGFSLFTEADGLSKNVIIPLFEDKEGNLWIGTETAGVNLLRDGKFISYSTADGMPEQSVRTVIEDRDGGLWLGLHAKGVSRFKNGAFETFDARHGVAEDGIRGLLEDSRGRLWVGTYNEGLLLYENGAFSRPDYLEGIPKGSVRSLAEDRHGVIWIGIYGKGVVELTQTPEGPKTRLLTEKDGLASDQVLFIKEDTSGALWIGTWGKGLTRYKDGQFKVYRTEDGLGHDVVLDMYDDGQGNLFFGTYGGGLALLRGDKFANITKRDGLFEDAIYVILPDDQGNLWMSCNKGVFRHSRQQLLDFADGKLTHVDAVSYSEADGMKQRECNGGSSPAGVRTKDGMLWFPTVDGIAGVDPANLEINSTPPPLMLEQVLVNDKERPRKARLRIEPGAEKIEFHYTSASFISPDKIVFKYKLEGFDREFVDAGTRRVAYYTNLSPGEYRFVVAARNADGVWSKDTTLVSFELIPAFYQTLWFQLSCLAAFGLVIFAIARIRLVQIKRQNVLLEQKVKERTAELEEAHVRIVALEKETTEKQMAGGFAHEIRNSLAGAKMMINKILCPDASAEQPRSLAALNSERLLALFKLAKDELSPASVQRLAGLVKEMHESEKNVDLLTAKAFKSIERSLDVTTLIMDYSKIGAAPVSDTLLDLGEIVGHVVEDHRREFEDLGVAMEHAVPSGLVIRGTESHFYSVFNNLLLNAKDALLGPGRRSNEPRLIRIDGRREERGVRISVWDNGEGIPAANLKKIFDPFFSTKPDTGTGLGLGMVTKYLSLYNGELDVQSEEGRATEFVVSLPITESIGETRGVQ